MLITEFEKRVRENPDKIAIRSAGICLTYGELKSRANRVASLVRQYCPQEESRVGLLFDQGGDMIIAMLATLIAGRTYVPISTDYPEERIAYMLSDSQASLLLTSHKNQFSNINELKGLGIEIIDINLEYREQDDQDVPPQAEKKCQPAYIMYTSGSTGQPKGVIQTHENIMYFIKDWGRRFAVSSCDHMTLFSSFCHDGSVQDIYTALLHGAVLYPMDMKQRDENVDISEFLVREDITVWHSVPSLFSFFTASLEGKPQFNRIRYIILGGEAVRQHELRMQSTYFPNSLLANVYGQTESSVNAIQVISPEESVKRIMIGQPQEDTEIYVVDEDGEPVEPLESGEILVVSNHISPGYWRNDSATEAVFGEDEDSGRYYWTGDLGCLHPNGDIEFLGRKDYQVKIRGYRIEPGEIESQLLTYDGLDEAVVLDRDGADGDKYLCAYFKSDRLGEDCNRDLRNYLARKLPEYMIPAFFVKMSEFPLTGTGKINRKALPEPGAQIPGTYVPPENSMQEKMRDLWAGLLGVNKEKIGVDHNFFELGGHSLKAVNLIARIQKVFSVKLTLSVVFDAPTIRGLCQFVPRALSEQYRRIETVEEKEYYPLTPAQHRFYMMQQLNPESTAFNIVLPFPMAGKMDMNQLTTTLNALVERHESLRTSFRIIDGSPVQIPHPPWQVTIQIVETHIRPIPSPFDLECAPLIRVAAITGKQGNMLVVEMHHIISDGTSTTILIKDFTTLFSGGQLPPLEIRYRDFAHWQVRQLFLGKYKDHENYWLNCLKGPLPLLNLPGDFPRPEKRNYAGGMLKLNFGSELTGKIKTLSMETGTTLYMILLAAYTILLSRRGGQYDIIVGSPVAGRGHADLEGVIGLVIGSVLMRNYPSPGKSFREFLDEVKTNTLDAFEHQDYPFEELLKKIGWSEEPGRSPIADVALIVQNLFDNPMNSPASSSTNQVDKAEPKLSSHLSDTISKLDLTIVAHEGGGDIFLNLEFARELFSEDWIRKFALQLVNILYVVTRDSDITLGQIDLSGDFKKIEAQGLNRYYYYLSHPQKRIYYTEKVYPGTSCNNLSFSIRFKEILDHNYLEKAINLTLQRNSGLRLRMVESESHAEPRQYIADYTPYLLEKMDLTHGKKENVLARIAAQPEETIDNPLYYFAYLVFNGGESGFFVRMHHLVSDGWSLLLLIQEITDIYDSLKAGNSVHNKQNPSYMNFINHENGYLNSAKGREDKQFWHDYLLPLPEAISLGAKKISNNRNIAARSRVFALDRDLRARIHEYKNLNSTSVYKIIFSALAIFMARVSGGEEAVIAGANHNRSTGDFRRTQGMFVSTLPFRIDVDMKADFTGFLESLGHEINHVLKNHGQYPFNLLMEELKELTGSDAGYLLDINLIGHTDLPVARYESQYYFTGWEPSPLAIHINTSNKDIRGVLELEWDYQLDIFSHEQIKSMHMVLVNILEQVLENPGIELAKIDLLPPGERTYLLEHFNSTTQEPNFSSDKSVVGLIEDRAEQSPHRVALTAEGTLTYGKLLTQAGNLAGQLVNKGVQPGELVALMLEPSLDMAIAILGVLMVGAAYLPLDPRSPEQRISFMLSDSAVRVQIGSGDSREQFGKEIDIISLDQSGEEDNKSLSLSSVLYNPDFPAYVIYTSGSTGRPKGVVVNHRNLLGYIDAFNKEFPLQSGDTVIQQASYAFDAFMEEFYPILICGGKLAIAKRDMVPDVQLLAQFIARHKVTMISCSPRLLKELNLVEDDLLKSLRIIISGGDKLYGSFVDNLINVSQVYNTYGPTETTVCATYYHCPKDVAKVENVPIGTPIANYRLFIRDSLGKPLPRELAGEMVITGVGVARGYLNRPELTAEKFSGDFYKTGDLCRITYNGLVEFLGRIDRQVQVRGFRVEPGEIEILLLDHENIKEAVVIDRQNNDGDTYLCAYYVPIDPGDDSLDVPLRDYLGKSLPPYMIPSFFLQMEDIPLTPGGKVDRNALPEPNRYQRACTVTPPENRTQEILINIWREVLFGSEEGMPFGIDDNFFDLGGHSLKATQLISRTEIEMGVKISLAAVFSNSTIRQLSEIILSTQIGSGIQVPRSETLNLAVLLKDTPGATKNLFMIHEGSGEVEGYHDLCSYLDSPIHCWGIRAHRFKGLSPVNLEIETLATEYIQCIKQVQPHDPICLLGWSIGGSIAFEMVRQLEEKGEQVGFFAMVDTLPPNVVENREDVGFTTKGEIQWLEQRFPVIEMTESLQEFENINDIWNTIVNYLKSNPKDANLIREILAGYPGLIIPGGNKLEIAEVIRYLNVIRSLGRARDKYQPEVKIATPIHYIQPARSLVKDYRDWSPYACGEIIAHQIPGDHYSIFKKPDVAGLAAHIGSLITKTFDSTLDNKRRII